MLNLRNGSIGGDSNPASLDCESGILPLSHCTTIIGRIEGSHSRGRPRMMWMHREDNRASGQDWASWMQQGRHKTGTTGSNRYI